MNDPIRLLVIEDETAIRRFLRVVLEGAGYTVDEAARGREGVTLAATLGLGIVLARLARSCIFGLLREHVENKRLIDGQT